MYMGVYFHKFIPSGMNLEAECQFIRLCSWIRLESYEDITIFISNQDTVYAKCMETWVEGAVRDHKKMEF